MKIAAPKFVSSSQPVQPTWLAAIWHPPTKGSIHLVRSGINAAFLAYCGFDRVWYKLGPEENGQHEVLDPIPLQDLAQLEYVAHL